MLMSVANAKHALDVQIMANGNISSFSFASSGTLRLNEYYQTERNFTMFVTCLRQYFS